MSRPALGLACIVLAYLAIAVQYAARTPDWQVPDEPAHYNYVRYIVENGALPSLEFGDYDQTFNEQFTNPKNTPNLSIDPLRYEFHQPPLYYLIAAPVYAVTDGDLFALRLVSVALGGALIVAAYFVVRELRPNRPELALGTAGFAAFVPQHVAMMAGVNNDSLAELLLALILLQTIRALKKGEGVGRGDLFLLGVVLGLGLVTKTTDYLAAPIVILALLSGLTLRPLRFAFHAPRIVLVLAPAFALGALWWLRNIGVYGGFDILGLARHNAVVVGQPLTSDWIARMGFGPFLIGALTTTFHSFWGQFGWMAVPMPDWVYLILGALSLVALVGWLLALRSPISLPGSRTLLFLLTLFTFAAYIWYNLTFVQHQGRYLYPALIPLGLAFSIGLDRWMSLLPRRIDLIAFVAVFVGLAGLCLFALYRFVIPALTG